MSRVYAILPCIHTSLQQWAVLGQLAYNRVQFDKNHFHTCGWLALGHNPKLPSSTQFWEEGTRHPIKCLHLHSVSLDGIYCKYSMTSTALYHHIAPCPYISILDKHNTHYIHIQLFPTHRPQCCSDVSTPWKKTAGLCLLFALSSVCLSTLGSSSIATRSGCQPHSLISRGPQS